MLIIIKQPTHETILGITFIVPHRFFFIFIKISFNYYQFNETFMKQKNTYL